MEELPKKLIRRAKDRRKYHEGTSLAEPLLPNSKWYPTEKEIHLFRMEKQKPPQQRTPPSKGRLLNEEEKKEAFKRASEKINKEYNKVPYKHRYEQSYVYKGDCEDVWEKIENDLSLDDVDYSKKKRI